MRRNLYNQGNPIMKTRLASILFFACAPLLSAADLAVYAIDVEGGKSTLFVSPTGESMLWWTLATTA